MLETIRTVAERNMILAAALTANNPDVDVDRRGLGAARELAAAISRRPTARG